MSGYFNSYNSSVRSVTLNLGHDRGVELLRALIATSDVLIENFTPGTMERWGLGPDEVRTLRPEIVMVRMPLVGSVGPRAGIAGGGNHLAAMGGLMSVCGPEGGEPSPVGPRGILPDYATNPMNASIALLAALHARRRTGRGQLIEIPQFESVANVMGPALLECALTGTVRGVAGNRSARSAPHNAYRCRDGDGDRQRWVAIAVRTDDEWRAMASEMTGEMTGETGRALGPEDGRFATLADRKAHERELDALIERWTLRRTADEVVTVLQAAGVPAAPVRDGFDLLEDEQLRYREHYARPVHEEVRTPPLNRLGFRLGAASHGPVTAAPLLGEHTDQVLGKVLGLSPTEIAAARESGALD